MAQVFKIHVWPWGCPTILQVITAKIPLAMMAFKTVTRNGPIVVEECAHHFCRVAHQAAGNLEADGVVFAAATPIVAASIAMSIGIQATRWHGTLIGGVVGPATKAMLERIAAVMCALMVGNHVCDRKC